MGDRTVGHWTRPGDEGLADADQPRTGARPGKTWVPAQLHGRVLSPDARNRFGLYERAEARAEQAQRAYESAQQRQSQALSAWYQFRDEVDLDRSGGHQGGMADVLWGSGEPHGRRGRARVVDRDGEDGLSRVDKER